MTDIEKNRFTVRARRYANAGIRLGGPPAWPAHAFSA